MQTLMLHWYNNLQKISTHPHPAPLALIGGGGGGGARGGGGGGGGAAGGGGGWTNVNNLYLK